MSRLAPYAPAHEDPSGPGDARPTAQQIIDDQGLAGKLQGKVVLITGLGSTEGIGYETAKAVASTGADVFVTSRHGKGQAAVDGIKATKPAGRIEHLELELDSFTSIRKAADEFKSKSKTLNIIICNAGVMACPPSKTKDGFELQFGTNHLGHFLLFQSLKDVLLRSATPDFPSRVVTVSSIGHTLSPIRWDDINFEKDPSTYEPWTSYAQSKTANALMAAELERRYGSQGLHGWSVHPGGIWTPLQRHQEEMKAGWQKDEELGKTIKSTAQGAATSVWAATSKDLLAEGKRGLYLEDCAESESKDKPGAKAVAQFMPGHAAWVYDAEAGKRLWDISLEMTKTS